MSDAPTWLFPSSKKSVGMTTEMETNSQSAKTLKININSMDDIERIVTHDVYFFAMHLDPAVSSMCMMRAIGIYI